MIKYFREDSMGSRYGMALIQVADLLSENEVLAYIGGIFVT